MQWQLLVQQIRYAGRYATYEQAEHVLEEVLGVLGGQIGAAQCRELAAVLPARAAEALDEAIGFPRPLSAAEFVGAVNSRLPELRPVEARWAAATVLTVLGRHAGSGLTLRLLAGLPAGHAALFGRTEPAPAAA